MKGLIAEALHLSRSAINDSTPLTDYGISSLQVVQLVQSVNLHLGTRMTFGVVQAETVGNLIDLISNKVKLTGILEAETMLDKHIVPFKQVSEEETGVILPGMPGMVDGYFELAESILESTVYGIQIVGFDGKADPLSSLPSMAKHYAAMIQQAKPKGKITLYAHSYGGLILFELLKILKPSETRVDEIFLLDSYAHTLTMMNQTEKHAFFLYLMGVQLQLSVNKEEAQTFSKKLIRQPKHKRAALLHEYLIEKGAVINKEFFEQIYKLYNTSMNITYRPKGKLDLKSRLSKRETL